MAWYDEKIAALSADGVELSESDINIMKKYTNETQFNKAAFHAFRRASASITLPTGDDNEKRQQTMEILRKLGADKENYEIKIPDGYPEDIRPSDEAIAKFKEQAAENGILPFQAKKRFDQALDALKTDYDTKKAEESELLEKRNESLEKVKKSLTEDHGDGYNEHIQSIRTAMEKYEYGQDLFDDKKQPTDKFFEMGDNLKVWEKIASDNSEIPFTPGSGGGGKTTKIDYSKKYPNSNMNPDGTIA